MDGFKERHHLFIMFQLNTSLVVPTDRRFLNRPAATEQELSIVGISPDWAEYVRVLDRQGNLALLHYVNTFVSDTDKRLNEEPLKAIGSIRGTIVDTVANRVVCRSFGYTPDVVVNDTDRLNTVLPAQDFTQTSFYRACEGTVVRLYHYNGEWQISTHRKINAEKSYWAGPTFGEMFSELRQFNCDDLNTDRCYAFLMSHSANRLVYKVPQNQLMLIAIWDRSTGSFVQATETDLPKGTVLPTPVVGMGNVSELCHMVDSFADIESFDAAGVIAIKNDNPGQPIKIVNEQYDSLRNARGNDPNVRARYVQLRGTPAGGLLVKFFGEPEYQEAFDAAETEIDTLVRKLHGMYINRYVKKDFSDLPKEEFVTLQRCHTWHCEDRQCNIVTQDKVREILNGTPNHYLLIMLNRQRRAVREQERAAALAAAAETETETETAPSPTEN